MSTTTALDFKITLANIASAAQKLGMLADGVTLEYRHNGQGHAPYVYAIPGDGEGADNLARLATRDASEFLPVFTYRYTRRESMAALEACERALSHLARWQAARQQP
jgi:hypothetical protein